MELNCGICQSKICRRAIETGLNEWVSESEKKNKSNITHNKSSGMWWSFTGQDYLTKLTSGCAGSLWCVAEGLFFSVRWLVEEVICHVIIFLFCFSYELEYLACATLMSLNGDVQFNGLEIHNYSKAKHFSLNFVIRARQLWQVLIFFFHPIFTFVTLKMFTII